MCYTILQVKMNGKEKLQTFFVTNLRKDRVLLGWPSFSHFNLKVDWAVRMVQGDVKLKMRWLKWRRRVATQDKGVTLKL